MRGKNIGGALAILAMLVALEGCQLVGPSSISQGRDRYNTILQSTAMEQTMSNIVRVYEHQPTLFMDVTEVDATLSVGGSLVGSATNIGAVPGKTGNTLTGRLGAATGTVQYSETPTVRYQPLLGQALVAQLVTPVSVDALGLLYDSSWPAAPLLDMASAYLTLDYDEFYAALNTIIELDDRGALELAAAKSDLPQPIEPEKAMKTPSATGPAGAAAPGKPTGTSDNDSLFIFLRPYHPHATPEGVAEKRRVLQLWVRLLRIYPATQPRFQPRDPRCSSLGLSADSAAQLRDWDVGIAAKPETQLDAARRCLPGHIELRVVPAPTRQDAAEESAGDLVSRAPLMRTYSALGILKAATERPHPKIEFVTPARYHQIRDPATHRWNNDTEGASFYILLPEDEDSVDCPPVAREQRGGCDNPKPAKGEHGPRIDEELSRWLTASAAPEPAPPAGAATGTPAEGDPYHGLFVYEDPGQDVLSDRYVRINQQLGLLRRYMLIVVDDAPPAETPYVAYENNGRWYYIAADDTISQKNFHLLSLFLTMMAVPPSTQPLSPVINVGG